MQFQVSFVNKSIWLSQSSQLTPPRATCLPTEWTQKCGSCLFELTGKLSSKGFAEEEEEEEEKEIYTVLWTALSLIRFANSVVLISALKMKVSIRVSRDIISALSVFSMVAGVNWMGCNWLSRQSRRGRKLWSRLIMAQWVKAHIKGDRQGSIWEDSYSFFVCFLQQSIIWLQRLLGFHFCFLPLCSVRSSPFNWMHMAPTTVLVWSRTKTRKMKVFIFESSHVCPTSLLLPLRALRYKPSSAVFSISSWMGCISAVK